MILVGVQGPRLRSRREHRLSELIKNLAAENNGIVEGLNFTETDQEILVDIRNVTFKNCAFLGATWRGTLQGVEFVGCDIKDLSINKGFLVGVSFSNHQIGKLTLRDATAHAIDFRNSYIDYLDLGDVIWDIEGRVNKARHFEAQSALLANPDLIDRYTRRVGAAGEDVDLSAGSYVRSGHIKEYPASYREWKQASWMKKLHLSQTFRKGIVSAGGAASVLFPASFLLQAKADAEYLRMEGSEELTVLGNWSGVIVTAGEALEKTGNFIVTFADHLANSTSISVAAPLFAGTIIAGYLAYEHFAKHAIGKFKRSVAEAVTAPLKDWVSKKVRRALHGSNEYTKEAGLKVFYSQNRTVVQKMVNAVQSASEAMWGDRQPQRILKLGDLHVLVGEEKTMNAALDQLGQMLRDRALEDEKQHIVLLMQDNFGNPLSPSVVCMSASGDVSATYVDAEGMPMRTKILHRLESGQLVSLGHVLHGTEGEIPAVVPASTVRSGTLFDNRVTTATLHGEIDVEIARGAPTA